jgi:hypothetical protein
MSIGGGGRIDIITVDFKLDSTDINTKTIYRIKYGDYDLQAEFKLKSYASFDTLEEIGPTETHNDISITAVAERKDGKLEVQLYPINKSGYNIKAYTKEYGKGYGVKDLSIETSNGTKTYITPGSYMSPNSKFIFDVSQDEKDMLLKIPYLIVQSNESKNIDLIVPKSGEKLQLNERVEFKGSTMIVTDVERVSDHGGEYGALKIGLRYENHDKNLIMQSAGYTRTNFWGMPGGGGYSFDPDGNGVVSTVYYDLQKGENNKLYLKVGNPSYYLLGEYDLKLK